MSDDLITSLRALAAARHDDLSVAVDAVIEIERQRAEIERLFNEDTKTRHALKGWVYVCPDGGDEPTHERVAAVVAEVERLRAERDALRDAAREYLETLGGAIKSREFEMGGTPEMAHFVRQAMQKLDNLVFDRAGTRPDGLEKLHEPLKKPS